MIRWPSRRAIGQPCGVRCYFQPSPPARGSRAANGGRRGTGVCCMLALHAGTPGDWAPSAVRVDLGALNTRLSLDVSPPIPAR